MRDSLRISLSLLIALMVAECPGWAADPFPAVNAARVRATFVLNLSRFVEWPVDVLGSTGQIRVCAVGDAPLAGALGAMAPGRKLSGLPVEVVSADSAQEWLGCHVLFVSHWDSKRIPKVLAAAKGAAILTISDAPGFVEQGGLVGVSVDGAQVRFSINREGARRNGLRFSSQVLRLADARY